MVEWCSRGRGINFKFWWIHFEIYFIGKIASKKLKALIKRFRYTALFRNLRTKSQILVAELKRTPFFYILYIDFKTISLFEAFIFSPQFYQKLSSNVKEVLKITKTMTNFLVKTNIKLIDQFWWALVHFKSKT